jgi:hypothetical protein
MRISKDCLLNCGKKNGQDCCVALREYYCISGKCNYYVSATAAEREQWLDQLRQSVRAYRIEKSGDYRSG